ncbi:MAG: nitrogenase iron-molybdenum cofactor biosynthesis protein NifN [Paenibacillaceae bacterium]|jgi:nitrogenase molybdenum-iron protein NifN|nr:nitrogenase iron-molybdenum cofactor biosynthesis protein NifN [Paenibacillaceae bacterium]
MGWKCSNKPLSINPHKTGQPLGGVLALQGFYRAMPLLHGSQGCSAFIKALMTRHYREPIAAQTTALQEHNVIFGGGKSLREGLDTVIDKHRPALIGILSTALTEVSGEDIEGELRMYRKERGLKDTLVVAASLPDFRGSLESGYAKTTEAVVAGIIDMVKEERPRKKSKNRVNLLVAPHLTPGDVMELKEIISSFGLEVIALPDISTSLSGHLLTGHTALSRGGLPLDYAKHVMTAESTIVVGECMVPAARKLEEAAGIPFKVFPSLLGLQATDQFFAYLAAKSHQEVPVRYKWQREFLLDSMLDAHFVYGGKKLAVALEPDHLYGVAGWLREMGAIPAGLVAPSSSPVFDRMEEEVLIGDLGDLEDIASGSKVDAWISSSHGEQGAERLKLPFYPSGFPIFDRFGSSMAVGVGYKGTTDWVNGLGNALLTGERRRHA